MAAKVPCGLEIRESCLSCTLRAERLFCDLPDEALAAFDEMKYTAVYPKGAILFVEGQDPLGVYVVCAGRVKLFTCSRDGRTLIMRVAGPGDVLGVSAVIAGQPHETTAETLEPCQVMCVKRGAFVRFLGTYGDASLRVAQLLANTCQSSHRQARTIGLSHSAEEKLARFLLERCDESGEETEQGVRFRLGLTHDEIAQLIGVSRETVSRLLSRLRRERVLQSRGGVLIVRDRSALEGPSRL